MRTTLALLALAAAATACAKADAPPADSAAAAASAAPADTTGAATSAGGSMTMADVKDASGRSLGTLTLAAGPSGGISAVGRLIGLAPGAHGIHIHAVGQCAAPFESAGPHWNPASKQHGSENPQGPHAGDMPNLTAGADSAADVNVSASAGMLDSLMDADGAAVVVHASADDYKTDPSGNSGGRIACGVVMKH